MEYQKNETETKKDPLFTRSILKAQEIFIFISAFTGENIKENLTQKIKNKIEGKTIREGYVRPNSVEIINYTMGKCSGESIRFLVDIECDLCYPYTNMILQGRVTFISESAGVMGKVSFFDETTSKKMPFIQFYLHRDIHMGDSEDLLNKLNEVKETNKVEFVVLGCRYQLYDTEMEVIGKLIKIV